jgi:hypothetical protein
MTSGACVIDIGNRYRRHHCTGLDCRLTNLRNLLDYFGYKESYSSVFGLSSSFDFGYRKSLNQEDRLQYPDFDFSPFFYSVTGHRFDCIEQMAFNCSASMVGNYPDSPEASLARMRHYLGNSIPVMVALSRMVISQHMRRPDGFPEYLQGIEFGGHWVILTAIDDVKKTVTIYDTDSPNPIEMPQEVFQFARTCGDDHDNCLMKSRNRWVVFVPPARLPSRVHMVQTALAKTVYHMKIRASAEESYRGLHGLQVFARELPLWPEMSELKGDRLKASTFILQLNAEVLSSGLGRKLFASFLHQSADICKSDALQEAANLCSDASRCWRQLVHILAPITNVSTAPSWNRWDKWETEVLLERILGLETKAVDKIEDFVDRGN